MKETILIKNSFQNPDIFEENIASILNFPDEVAKPGNLVCSGFETVLFDKKLTHLIYCPITVQGGYIVPETVKSLGVESFSQCRELTSIVLSPVLNSIGCLAFENCTSLTSISIPATVEEIGYRVFSNCTGLKAIYVESKSHIPLRRDSQVFYNVRKDACILYVPRGSKTDYQLACQWNEFESIIEIDESVYFSNS